MKRDRYAFLVIFLISSISLKNINCDGELTSKQIDKLNIKIAVILPISEYLWDEHKCSETFFPDVLQNVEAVYYALDLIEKDNTLSQKFTLTVDVMEDCNFPSLEMKHLSRLFDQLQLDPMNDKNATVGLIYKDDSTGLNYENIFKTFPTFPHISYSGPPTRINDVNVITPEYKSDFITPTSGHIFIADVIFEILNNFQWKYIAVHHYRYFWKDDEIRNFFEKRVQELSKSNDVCITDDFFNEEFGPLSIHTDNMVDVIICYCDRDDIEFLNWILQKHGKKYVVIAGNIAQYWTEEVKWNSDSGDLYYVTPALQYYEKFYHYYTSLTKKNDTRHPFLEKFRERYFNAKFDSETRHEETSNNIYKDTYQNNSNAAVNIIKSMYAMAHTANLTLQLTPPEVYRDVAGELLRHVGFELFDEIVDFTSNEGLPSVEKFDVHKYQATQNGSGNFIKVAEYLKQDHENPNLRIRGKLTILDSSFQHPKHYPKQRCSNLCPAGQFRKIRDNRCCWDCTQCDPLEILRKDATSCEKCTDGFMANKNHNVCIPIHTILQLPIKWNDINNLVSIGFSSFSIVLAVATFCVFVKYQDTPAVKSTTRELSYVMLAGIILINITLFISAVTLSFQSPDEKVLLAIGFTMIYAALLAKTNRISRILVTSKHKFANINPKYASLKAQIIITSILIGMEILICWFTVKFHDTKPGTDERNFILSMYYLDSGFFIKIFAFVAILILFCVYYAIKTRNLPTNFNETKCIGFAMYVTVLTATAFSLAYFATEKKILAMSLCASINSLTILIFLFSPKLYIILWKPKKNTRVYFSPVTTNIRSYIGNESRPNSHKSSNQYCSLEISEPQSNFNNEAANLKHQERDVIVKVIKEIDNILYKELILYTLKDKVNKGDLKPEAMDDLQKAYSQKIEKIRLKYNIEANRVEKNDVQ